ncbi:MAG: CPBP family glutamic-type intramembrane protease [Cyanobacteria bacterium P01_D01_bin.105]
MAVKRFDKPLFGLLWLMGFVGELSVLFVSFPAEAMANLPLPVFAIKLISLLQALIILSIANFFGVMLSPKVGLSAPLSEAFLSGNSDLSHIFKQQALPGLIGGSVGIALNLAWFLSMKPLLPLDFLTAAANTTIPFATRLLKGGIAEEIVLRWGLMTLLVWLCWRLLQKGKGQPHGASILIATVVSALMFGLLHLPAAALLSASLTLPLVVYVIIGNTIFGLVAGYLYVKHGLESAMLAHMFFHVVLVAVQKMSFTILV